MERETPELIRRVAMADLVRLSKFLAVMLRHEPEQFGLTLDEEGFANTDAVWAQVGRRYPGQYSYADLLKVVEGDQDGKKRYEIRGRRIRAMYGHSEPRVIYPPAEPPDTLYHGTTREALASIRQHGLQSRGRQYVHLTTTTRRATTVAGRHRGSPVILVVRSGDAARAGVRFYHPEAEHYLADAVPPEFIEFPDSAD
jgi:putative RNA 2'-phosphotransferase